MDKPANRFYGEQKLKPGDYGVVSYYGISTGRSCTSFAELNVPDLMTAVELREAAHLFVQLAEYLENNL